MSKDTHSARIQLEGLLRTSKVTRGLTVRVHGDNLILARSENAPDGKPETDDRLKLTRLGASAWGLSVKRHTGRWERTPFSGNLREMVGVICEFMQHLVAQ